MATGERRYSDREVALILRRAAEMEDREGVAVTARGVSLQELEQIAQDVGLDPARIRRAALELQTRRSLRESTPLGPAPSRTAVVALDATVAGDALRDLVRVIDDEVDSPGTVTEALGAVRWTARDRFLTTQVAIAPAPEGTTVKVHERIDPRVRGLLHFVPGGWGAILGIAIAGSTGVAALPAVGVVAACALAGGAAGRGVWEILSERSRRRVDALAETLASATASMPDPKVPRSD